MCKDLLETCKTVKNLQGSRLKQRKHDTTVGMAPSVALRLCSISEVLIYCLLCDECSRMQHDIHWKDFRSCAYYLIGVNLVPKARTRFGPAEETRPRALNLVPRVLRLFAQRVGARRDSGEFEKN